jgi:RNA polymerase sigma factor (sigma-70 family)
MTTSPSMEELASLAAAGDRGALNALLNDVQHPLYRLSLRFLGNPADAQDATQEIMIRLTTHLSTFEGRSSFTTWAYTIATRMLMRTKMRTVESSVVSAERFAQFLDAGIADRDYPAEAAEYRELCEEVRLRCTYGMLLALSRPLRAAYLLGDVLGLTDQEGAEICEITPAAFRQRLSRGRRTLREIIDGRCGLVDATNSCKCGRQIAATLDAGLMERSDRTFCSQQIRTEVSAIDPESFEKVADQIEDIVAIGSLYRRDRFAAPVEMWSQLQSAMPDLLDA